MASLQTLERRILALEARLADIEGGYGETLYKLHRGSIRTGLGIARIMQHLGVAAVSDEEVDAALDEDAQHRLPVRPVRRFPWRA